MRSFAFSRYLSDNILDAIPLHALKTLPQLLEVYVHIFGKTNYETGSQLVVPFAES